MEIRLQPKPEVEIKPTDKGIISKAEYFVEKTFEQINQYCFPALLIRNWKPKAQLLYSSVPDESSVQYECDFNRKVQNCFVEDYAEEVFLRTPPPCFVVIGKCGTSVNKLGQEIAEEYGSVLIQVDDVINQVIQTETETSNLLHKILRLGVSLTLNFILPLLSFLAHTPEARHRGYVLCGLPRIPDLWDLSVEQQFNYLFTWDNKPTVFINVLFDDEDLIKERISLRCEIKSAQKGKFILFHDEYEELSEEEEEVENPEEKDFLPIKEAIPTNIDVDVSPSRPWVRLPRDEESQVWSELELFNTKLKPAIELITSRVDPQYFITVDSRVQNEFEIVRARLSLLQIWKSPAAFPFIVPKPETDDLNESNLDADAEEKQDDEKENAEDDEEAEMLRVAEEPPQVAFLTLFRKKTISPKFLWELSHYNYICPVSLRNSVIVEGKSAYAVAFMKYIYFLHDEECMKKFLQNPRAYVLPIRPKPLCRFIILGFPLTGKTTLAKALSKEFCIPLLNLNRILQADIDRKKHIYVNFCKQKAECREILRLTSLAWQDWRMEEEQRVSLIENWIIYIQSLLNQRITQFYFPEAPLRQTKPCSTSESGSQIEIHGEDYGSSEESKAVEKKALTVQGTAIDLNTTDHDTREFTPAGNHPTASLKIMHAMKHEDFDFNENCLEVEANLFFSSLWNTFANKRQKNPGDASLDGEGDETQLDRESEIIDWSKLLPAQSLSSFMLARKPYTIREKRRSFQVLLEAASKNYWTENSLKAEFAKWRLPCFMDIPLCEIFVDNPLLLLKYVPEWLKERPPIPSPVDPKHPSVISAGEKAFAKAGVVKISQNYEEVAVLLRDTIEKAEREGMRVTGEVISPGGWVLDNMTLDIDVWKKLVCENIFADHIYILMDPDPEYRRILKTWCDLYCPSDESLENKTDWDKKSEISKGDEENSMNFYKKISQPESFISNEMNLGQTLKENEDFINQNEEELDEIFYELIKSETAEVCHVEFQADPFCHGVLSSRNGKIKNIKVESLHEETTSTIQFHSESTSVFISHLSKTDIFSRIPLGTKFQIFTKEVLQLFEDVYATQEKKEKLSLIMKNELEFFINLLTIPQKLDQITEFLTSINRENVITKIDITDKSQTAVFNEINEKLLEPFLKKPRELEEFEMIEIEKWTARDGELEEEEDQFQKKAEEYDDEKEEEIEDEEEKEEEEKEDIRIFGESGSLCIVNLERNILLPGKPEHALRYYGKLYYFWDERAKKKFIANPEKYAPYYSAIRCYPPLRVFVMGPIGSGKSKLCQAIAEQSSLCFVDYITLLNKNLVPFLLQPVEKFTALDEQLLLLKEEHNASAKAAKEQFMSAPLVYRTQWLECPFYSDWGSYKSIIETLKSNSGKIPSVFPELTYLNIEPETTNYSEEYDLPSPPPFLSMKEMESMLKKYIENVSDLDDYCVGKSLKKLWDQHPYVTEGFVLEGFPMRAFDVRRMLENNWIPDLVIELSPPEDVVVENNIELMMDLWDTKLKQETIEEKLLEDTLDVIQRSRKWSRRDELLLEKLEEAAREYTDKNEVNEAEYSAAEQNDETNKNKSLNQSEEMPPDLELKIIAEVEEILNQEFPPLEFKTIFETYDAGKARLLEDLVKNYQRDLQEMHAIKNLLQHANIKWFEINNENDYEANLNAIFRLLDKLKKRGDKKGEFAFTMKMETAEKLLEQGYYFLSKFGRWCPVQVYRLKNSIHMFRPLSSRGKVVPVAYRNYIYFIAGENEKKKFIEDPIKYTFNEPHHPNIPVRVAVIGPPKSGKSTLCLRLGAMFGLKVVTMGTALRFVVENIPRSTLAKNINNYLKRGCFLPLSLKVEALMACFNDDVCVTQGFALDGIPFDAALMQTLAERGKLPFVIISLTADVDFGKTNRKNLDVAPFRLPYKNRVNLDVRYKDWYGSYKKFSQWNHFTYNNLYEVNANLSTVDVFYQAYDIIRKSLFGILHYVEYCVSDKALPLQYLCVSHHEYELRKSPLENNCPVCWSELKRLNSTADPPERSGLVQYLANFYWVCPIHMEKFLKTPKIFFPPHADEWPRLLPRIITREIYKTMSPLPEVHGYGRCPVTRIDFPTRLDWEGSWDFAALYADRVYLCKSKEMLDRFLAQPWNYMNADSVFEANRPEKSKAVEELEPPIITSLPPIGFLEQTITKLIIETLRIVGSVRPVYPNMSVEVTGCIFLALLLKAETSKHKHLMRQYVNFMVQNCKASSYSSQSYLTDERLKEDDIPAKDSDSLDSENSAGDEVASISPSQMSSDSYWLDADFQADKQIWSAKSECLKATKMNLTAEDELEEIPTYPKVHVILNYQSYVTRHCPLPPINRCVTYVYSATPNLELPKPFNYNSLYQPIPLLSSPYPKSFVINSEKEFPLSLYNETESSAESVEYLRKGPRAHSIRSSLVFQPTGDPDYDMKLVAEHFVPRFQFLDKMPLPNLPSIPKVVDEQPIFYNPQRDQTYMMLYAEFFHMTHVLRCYEWSILDRYLELEGCLDRNIELTPPLEEITGLPRKRPSIEMKRSIDFYHDTFDACAKFVSPPQEETPDDSRQQSSTVNLVQNIILEKIFEILAQLSDTDLSYESFETAVVESEGKAEKSPSVLIREIFPYPPLPWDIVCRPYYAFASIKSIFNIPSLDNIAHERHFSLMDGIELVEEKIRFVRYPSWLLLGGKNNAQCECLATEEMCVAPTCPNVVKENLVYFAYDYFNLPWTSFLTYPFSWAYNEDITRFFKNNHQANNE